MTALDTPCLLCFRSIHVNLGSVSLVPYYLSNFTLVTVSFHKALSALTEGQTSVFSTLDDSWLHQETKDMLIKGDLFCFFAFSFLQHFIEVVVNVKDFESSHRQKLFSTTENAAPVASEMPCKYSRRDFVTSHHITVSHVSTIQG